MSENQLDRECNNQCLTFVQNEVVSILLTTAKRIHPAGRQAVFLGTCQTIPDDDQAGS